MKKFGQKLLLWFIAGLGYAIMLGMPTYLLLSNLIIGQAPKAIYSIITAVILFVSFIVTSKWLVKILDRKLQAIAVAEEIGVVPATPFILSRILRIAEIILPLAAIGFLLYGMTFITIPAYIVFRDIVLWVGIGSVLLFLHDGFKVFFTNINKIDDQIKLEDNVRHTRTRREYRTSMHRGRRGRNNEEPDEAGD